MESISVLSEDSVDASLKCPTSRVCSSKEMSFDRRRGLGSNNPDKVAILQSPALNPMQTYTLTFQYHMKGTAMGKLKVDVEESGAFKNLWEVSGSQGNAWLSKSFTISGASALRFVGVTGSGWSSDIALDAIDMVGTGPTTSTTTTTIPTTTTTPWWCRATYVLQALSPEASCAVWSTDSSSGALAGGKSLAQACCLTCLANSSLATLWS